MIVIVIYRNLFLDQIKVGSVVWSSLWTAGIEYGKKQPLFDHFSKFSKLQICKSYIILKIVMYNIYLIAE